MRVRYCASAQASDSRWWGLASAAAATRVTTSSFAADRRGVRFCAPFGSTEIVVVFFFFSLFYIQYHSFFSNFFFFYSNSFNLSFFRITPTIINFRNAYNTPRDTAAGRTPIQY